MFITIKLEDIIKPATVLVMIAAFVLTAVFVLPQKSVDAVSTYRTGTLVIDAGHGGVDGGAVYAA